MENKLESNIKVKIETAISEYSKWKIKDDINNKIMENISPETKYVVIIFYIQIGKSDEKDEGVLRYKNKNDITLFIQTKIRNYVEFKTYESARNYIKENTSKDDLLMLLEVENWHLDF